MFYGAISYRALRHEHPRSLLKMGLPHNALVGMPAGIFVFKSHYRSYPSVLLESSLLHRLVERLTCDCDPIFFSWRQYFDEIPKRFRGDSFIGMSSDKHSHGTLEYVRRRFAEIGIVPTTQNVRRAASYNPSYFEQFADVLVVREPNDWFLVDSELFGQLVSGGLRIERGLIDLVFEYARLLFRLLQLKGKDDESHYENSKSDDTENKTPRLEGTHCIVFYNLYRYSIGTVLLGFVFFCAFVAAELLWGLGWWYRCFRKLLGNIGPYWLCFWRAVCAFLVCFLGGLVLFHGVIIFNLF